MDSKIENLIRLYLKEREYQNNIFGNPGENPVLTPNSFLTFLDIYLNKAKTSMCENWTDEIPPWLNHCRELDFQDKAPVATYGYLIKIFALAGAALESFADIDPEFWRTEGINTKWKN